MAVMRLSLALQWPMCSAKELALISEVLQPSFLKKGIETCGSSS